MNLIELKNVNKIYEDNGNTVQALKNVNLTIGEKEFISIIGSSGSGKSTLLNILGGLDDITSGEFLYEGKSVPDFSENKLAQYRNSIIGFVFQSYNLIPVLSVYENIVLPNMIGYQDIDESYVDQILKRLGILDKKNVVPGQLSGGQQQRVAIARALANHPKIILADEPTGNLDSATSEEVVELLIQSCRIFQQTLIMITHNEAIAKKAHRIVRIKDGEIWEV